MHFDSINNQDTDIYTFYDTPFILAQNGQSFGT